MQEERFDPSAMGESRPTCTVQGDWLDLYELSRFDNPEEPAALAEEARSGRFKRDELRKWVVMTKSAAKGRGVPKTNLT